MPWDPSGDQWTLDQVMAWCHSISPMILETSPLKTRAHLLWDGNNIPHRVTSFVLEIKWQHKVNFILVTKVMPFSNLQPHEYLFRKLSLHWRHNDHNGVSNHQPHVCLLNRLFGCRSKKTSKPRVTGLCAGNSPGEFPAQMASNAENVSIWWRHHAPSIAQHPHTTGSSSHK